MPLDPPHPRLRLHGYWRSSTTYRVRIALNLKGLAWESVPVDLLAGDQRSDAYRRLQPQGLVPALEADGLGPGHGPLVLGQSPAILEWLEERFPTPPLLPADPDDRAVVRAMAAAMACDIHPLHNLRVFQRLEAEHGASKADVAQWAAHWIADGFVALEGMIARHGRGFAFGDRATLADCYLAPQVFAAGRFRVDLAPYPRLVAAAEAAAVLPAFAQAHPALQAGAPAA